MKAIINVPNGSAYRHLNGQSFLVTECMPNVEANKAVFALKIDEKTTADFSAKEVWIQDFQEELVSAKDTAFYNPQSIRIVKNKLALLIYKSIRKISFDGGRDL